MLAAKRIFGRRTKSLGFSLSFAALAAISLPAQETIADSAATDRVTALGRLLSEEVERRETVLADQAVQAYLATLSSRLEGVDNGDAAVSVFARRDVGAITLPGGRIYLSAGLIPRTRSEAELAALIAHEAAHLRLRHGVIPAAQPADSTAPIPLIFLGGWNGVRTRFATSSPHPVAFQATGAERGQQADEAARERLAAGFDPAALSRAFERVQNDRSDENAGGRVPQVPQAGISPEFERFRQRIEALLPSG